MKGKLILIFAMLGVVAFWGGLIWLAWQFVPNERVVDCRMAEFHPDFTPEMKQKCREVRT